MGKSIGILGCGWLGRAIAADLVGRGVRVEGTTTSDANAAELWAMGVDPTVVVFGPEVRGDVFALRTVDAVVVAIPPGSRIDPVVQARSIAETIATTTASHVIQISTTSVYAATGEMVGEEDAMSEHRLVRAEEAYQSLDRCVTILRCAGLFGPGRLILPFLLGAGAVVDEAARVNLVEQSDVVRAVVSVLDAPVADVFNVCADEHPTKGAFYRAIARRAGLGVPEFQAKGEPFRIIDNRKFKKAYGFQYAYPDPLAFPVGS